MAVVAVLAGDQTSGGIHLNMCEMIHFIDKNCMACYMALFQNILCELLVS